VILIFSIEANGKLFMHMMNLFIVCAIIAKPKKATEHGAKQIVRMVAMIEPKIIIVASGITTRFTMMK